MEKCKHRECEEAGKKLCEPGHEECIYVGCDDKKHAMARGPGGWIPDDDRPLGNTD